MEINAHLEGRDSRAERAGVAREVCMREGNVSVAVGANGGAARTCAAREGGGTEGHQGMNGRTVLERKVSVIRAQQFEPKLTCLAR